MSCCVSSAPDRTIVCVGWSYWQSSRSASRPERRGMHRSSSIRSGCVDRTISTVSWPLPASPTTRNPPPTSTPNIAATADEGRSSNRRRVALNIVSSSAITTRAARASGNPSVAETAASGQDLSISGILHDRNTGRGRANRGAVCLCAEAAKHAPAALAIVPIARTIRWHVEGAKSGLTGGTRSTASVLVEQPMIDGEQRELDPIRRANLVEHVDEVPLDGVFADAQARGELVVRFTVDDAADHLELAPRQPEPARVVARLLQAPNHRRDIGDGSFVADPVQNGWTGTGAFEER